MAWSKINQELGLTNAEEMMVRIDFSSDFINRYASDLRKKAVGKEDAKAERESNDQAPLT